MHFLVNRIIIVSLSFFFENKHQYSSKKNVKCHGIWMKSQATWWWHASARGDRQRRVANKTCKQKQKPKEKNREKSTYRSQASWWKFSTWVSSIFLNFSFVLRLAIHACRRLLPFFFFGSKIGKTCVWHGKWRGEESASTKHNLSFHFPFFHLPIIHPLSLLPAYLSSAICLLSGLVFGQILSSLINWIIMPFWAWVSCHSSWLCRHTRCSPQSHQAIRHQQLQLPLPSNIVYVSNQTVPAHSHLHVAWPGAGMCRAGTCTLDTHTAPLHHCTTCSTAPLHSF